MSKIEVDRKDRYNRQLFKPIKTGHYAFNPTLPLKIDICQFDKLHYHDPVTTNKQHLWWSYNHDLDLRVNNYMDNNKKTMKKLLGLS